MPLDGASIEDGYSVFDGMPYASAGIAEVRIRDIVALVRKCLEGS
jgi:hypothetical protein